MAIYLVDASVVAEFLIMGSHTASVRLFFRGALQGNHFIAPELCMSECTNVIWKAVQHRGMPVDQAVQAVRDLQALPLHLTPTKAVLTTALAIELKNNLPIYDSLYIALAVKNKLLFVTLDRKQGMAAAAEGVSVTPISNWSP
jgi:predicted nucleic acid-binding protein